MNNYKKYIAESLGTLLLVFIGASAVCVYYSLKMVGGQGAGDQSGYSQKVMVTIQILVQL